MTSPFNHLMAEATRLTRAGDLQGATAAIQAALAGQVAAVSAATAVDDPDVIDVEAREIHPEPARADEATPPPADRREPAPRPAVDGAGQFVTGRHTGAAGTRDYKLYIAPGPQVGPRPLIVMLHGCTQDPDDFAAGTRMNELAREHGCFVLYPAQSQGANPQRCWNWFKHNHQGRDRGEPALLAGMTREVMARHAVDPARVYVAGLSAGGAMAAILGDAYPELFAAVGVHSGLAAGAAKDLPSALAAMKGGAVVAGRRAATGRPPTIVFHGDADATVHPINGEQVVAGWPGVPESQRRRDTNGRDCTRRVWRDANGRPVAEHWTVHGAGHAWSGGSARGSYTDACGPDASRAMLDFFFASARRGSS